MTDQEPLATAIKAALTAALPTNCVAFDVDEVPGTNNNPGPMPREFVIIHISRMYEETRVLGGAVTVAPARLDVTYHAENVATCRQLRKRTTAALEGVILAGNIGPFIFNDETQSIDVDHEFNGYSGIDTFTF